MVGKAMAGWSSYLEMSVVRASYSIRFSMGVGIFFAGSRVTAMSFRRGYAKGLKVCCTAPGTIQVP